MTKRPTPSSGRCAALASHLPRHPRDAGLAQQEFFEEPAIGVLVRGGHRLSSFCGGDLESFERIFLAHMDEPEALLDLGKGIGLAKEQPVCLLCSERDPEHCRRMIAANRIVGETDQGLRHLFVDADAARPG